MSQPNLAGGRMKKGLAICFLLLFGAAGFCRHLLSPLIYPPRPLLLKYVNYPLNIARIGDSILLREGVTVEADGGTFKGCVMYLEGLGDSIVNHQPLFSYLADNGYRVISFDYMGQGGSEGSMDDTTIDDFLNTRAQITRQAKFFWRQHHECAQSPHMVIGWSTGGLAAYTLAHEGWANAIVLIAPGIDPNWFVGETAHLRWWKFPFQPIITLRTLTRNQTIQQPDPIRPDTPLRLPFFDENLMLTAAASRHWKINQRIAGLVFLSGDNDSYVDSEATRAVLKANAPAFAVVQYRGALHELDNELAPVASDLRLRTVLFFNFYMLGNSSKL